MCVSVRAYVRVGVGVRARVHVCFYTDVCYAYVAVQRLNDAGAQQLVAADGRGGREVLGRWCSSIVLFVALTPHSRM